MFVNLILGNVDVGSDADLELVLEKASGWRALIESGEVLKEHALQVVKDSFENRFSYEWADGFDPELGGVVSWYVHHVKPKKDGERLPWFERKEWFAAVEYFVESDSFNQLASLPDALDDFIRFGLQHDAKGRGPYLREVFSEATGSKRKEELKQEDAKIEKLYFKALRQISVRS